MEVRIPLLAVLTIGSLGGGALWFGAGGNDSDAATAAAAVPDSGLYTVTRSDLEITLGENGHLVAKDSRKVMLEAQRSGKITFLVEEGVAVVQSDVVCRFDVTELEEQIQQIQLDLVKTEADLGQARTELEIQTTQNQVDIEKAQAAQVKAGMDLERYRDGDAPQARRKLEVGIKDTLTTFNLARKRFEDSKRLIEQGFIKRTELKADEIAFEKAVVTKEGSELDLRLFERYTYPMTLAEKQANLLDAKRSLDTAQKRTRSKLQQKQVVVEQGEKGLEQRQKRLELAKKDLSNMILRAPCPGIVIYGDPQGNSWYRQQVKVGGEIWGGNTVMTIPDLRVMQVKLHVHEADINELKTGQLVKVTMDTYAGLLLEGQVTKIASIASSEGDNEVKKFDVDITLEGTEELQLKPGISAKAVIYIDRRKDVLYTPLQCVFSREAVHHCYVLGDDGRPELRRVVPGQSNDAFVEILEGLKEGERVLLYNPNLPTGAREETSAEGEAPTPDAEEAPPPAPPPTKKR